MRILLTGSNGFIGNHIIREAIKEDHEIIALIRPNSNSFKLKDNNIFWKNFDYQSFNQLENEKIDVIIHLAATGISPRKDTWENLIKINVELTLRVCQFAKKINSRLICAGSYEQGDTYFPYHLCWLFCL